VSRTLRTTSSSLTEPVIPIEWTDQTITGWVLGGKDFQLPAGCSCPLYAADKLQRPVTRCGKLLLAWLSSSKVHRPYRVAQMQGSNPATYSITICNTQGTSQPHHDPGSHHGRQKGCASARHVRAIMQGRPMLTSTSQHLLCTCCFIQAGSYGSRGIVYSAAVLPKYSLDACSHAGANSMHAAHPAAAKQNMLSQCRPPTI